MYIWSMNIYIHSNYYINYLFKLLCLTITYNISFSIIIDACQIQPLNTPLCHAQATCAYTQGTRTFQNANQFVIILLYYLYRNLYVYLQYGIYRWWNELYRCERMQSCKVTFQRIRDLRSRLTLWYNIIRRLNLCLFFENYFS